MYTSKMTTLPDYLTQTFLEWQAAEGQRKTLEDFAIYIGVSRPIVSFWMNGKRTPNIEHCEKISLRFGNEIYDVLGIARPDIYLQRINRIWNELSPEIQKRIADEAEGYRIQNETKPEKLQISRTKKKRSGKAK